jgi:putative membrane protein
MYIKKNFKLKGLLIFSGGHMIWLTAFATFVVVVYESAHWEWMLFPWLPISVIGTAVAFYVGFKNNSAYDRMWEARKIWGAIINSSRSWGAMVSHFVSPQFSDRNIKNPELQEIKKRLLYRHIGWCYSHRSQLLIPTPWEHVNNSRLISNVNKKRREAFGVGLFQDFETEVELKRYLPEDELDYLINKKNTATQIINKQAEDLAALRSKGLIDDFRHMELQKLLTDFYTQQGKNERIKKFPLPRQYGSSSFIFVVIFIFLLPFGLINEFHQLGEDLVWLTIPFTVLVGWVFVMMELIGDYSENPFEGLANDIPMLSLCRTIEIDLLEMLDEDNIPDPIPAKNDVLM